MTFYLLGNCCVQTLPSGCENKMSDMSIDGQHDISLIEKTVVSRRCHLAVETRCQAMAQHDILLLENQLSLHVAIWRRKNLAGQRFSSLPPISCFAATCYLFHLQNRVLQQTCFAFTSKIVFRNIILCVSRPTSCCTPTTTWLETLMCVALAMRGCYSVSRPVIA